MPLGDQVINALATAVGVSGAQEIDQLFRTLEAATSVVPVIPEDPKPLFGSQSYVNMYVPCASADPAASLLTDSTTGVAAKTFAAITAPAANATTALTADMVAVKNAMAQLVLTVNTLLTDMCAVKNLVAVIMSDMATQHGLGLTSLDPLTP